MTVMQPPTGPIEVSDPNNVPEQFVSSPFNIMNAAGMVHITLTTARPNPNDLFRGSATPEFRATVACRLLMPTEMAEQLTRSLANSLIKNAEASRPTPETVTRRTNNSDDVDRIFSDGGRLRS